MSWLDIIGHKNVLERFEKSAQLGRLASTYLFVGPGGIGKRTFALKLAQGLLCERMASDSITPCLECPSCQQVTANTHPDLIQVSKPKDKNFIPVELFIGPRERRRQEGLCHDISLKPFYGRRKIAIIDDADYLNAESANSLLKTLEEPPANSVLILIGTTEHRQLQTILSRSQVIRFQPLTQDQIVQVLENIDSFESELSATEVAAASAGSIERAIRLSDPDYFAFRNRLIQQMATLDPGQSDFSKEVLGFLDTSTKDSAVKRKLLSDIADVVTLFYGQLLHCLWGQQSSDQSTRSEAVSRAAQKFIEFGYSEEESAELVADAIDRTHRFQSQVVANGSPANIVPAWLADLVKIFYRERVFS